MILLLPKDRAPMSSTSGSIVGARSRFQRRIARLQIHLNLAQPGAGRLLKASAPDSGGSDERRREGKRYVRLQRPWEIPKQTANHATERDGESRTPTPCF